MPLNFEEQRAYAELLAKAKSIEARQEACILHEYYHNGPSKIFVVLASNGLGQMNPDTSSYVCQKCGKRIAPDDLKAELDSGNSRLVAPPVDSAGGDVLG